MLFKQFKGELSNILEVIGLYSNHAMTLTAYQVSLKEMALNVI